MNLPAQSWHSGQVSRPYLKRFNRQLLQISPPQSLRQQDPSLQQHSCMLFLELSQSSLLKPEQNLSLHRQDLSLQQQPLIVLLTHHLPSNQSTIR
mmetsp:Transcript_8693/g.23351  ORF Transcript_8693/g.23351 Transcript_8693/m.23351 type:complete len:95 (+) Transcript_8693:917-1201(+)